MSKDDTRVPTYTSLSLIPDWSAEPEQKKENSEEYKQIVLKANKIEDIPCNCWGAMIFMIVNDLPDLRQCRQNTLQSIQIASCFCMYIINFLVQGYMVYYIVTLLMMPSMRSAQDAYKMFHGYAFEDGNFQQEKFDRMPPTDRADVCELALAQNVFVRIILFLWLTNNVMEFVSTIKEMELVLWFPFLPQGEDTTLMVVDQRNEKTDEVENKVVCLTIIAKATLFTLVYIPKLVVVVMLTFSGCIWLLVSERVADLILNSLALGFVTTVDELIAHCFFPQYFQDVLKSACYGAPEDPDDKIPEELKKKQMKASLRSCLLLFCVYGTTELLIRAQPILPNYEDDIAQHCQRFIETRRPWCMLGMQSCFPTS